jgi:hypothetical protein
MKISILDSISAENEDKSQKVDKNNSDRRIGIFK